MVIDAHREIQERLLDKSILIFGIIAVPTLLTSLVLVFDLGWQPAFTVNSIAALLIILFAVFRKTISYPIKTMFLVAVYFIIAVSSSLNFGLNGFLLEFLMLSVFVGVVFCGKKQAIWIYAIGTATIAAIGFLHVKGIVPLIPDDEIYIRNISTWVAVLTTFMFITGLVILIGGEIGHFLSEKISELQAVNQELRSANQEIKTLQGILPICSNCKKIRDSSGYWNQVESYFEKNTNAKFSHGLCEECLEKLYGKQEWYLQRQKKQADDQA
ncbi:MAG: hypothetical protein C4522_18145 [Desulfobacteraceae bacterium]|nr:MAG: hypothetical protein C4522_18145 [Desulfobacteraceae bacterium]